MNKLLMIAGAALLLAACTTEPEGKPAAGGGGGGGEAPTNRIDIPPEVINNLGITFAKVELRRVEQTVRLPGHFETPPEARRQYRSPVAGRVSLLVRQFQTVEPGAEIARIVSPQWREMQAELDMLQAELDGGSADHTRAKAEVRAAEASASAFARKIDAYKPQLEALEEHRTRLTGARDQWKTRVTDLEDLIAKGGGRATELAEARAELASAESAISEETEKRAEIERARNDLRIDQDVAAEQLQALKAAETGALWRLQAAERSLNLKIAAAAALLGVPAGDLADDAWRKLDSVPVRAETAVTVLDLHVDEGEIIESGESICHAIDPARLRFRARGLQADLGKLKDGQPGRVVPPVGGTLQGATEAEGTIVLAPEAEAESRLLDVLLTLKDKPEWARPGVTAELEVVWDATTEPKPALPARAIIQDGLDMLYFPRDAADPDKVVRQRAILGPSDGRWTVVYNATEGSEVVLAGVYELKLTGAGKAPVGGHFHADGTWHAGPDHD